MTSENQVFRHLINQLPGEYKVKSYVATTQDGYLLKLFRVRPKDPLSRGNHPPVLMQHGLLSSAETWVSSGETAWPIHLLQAGYDVWLGNNRGNVYSRGHTTLTTEDDDYFNFSFYEMGKYDMPAMIDLIRRETGFAKVAIISHSQGTT